MKTKSSITVQAATLAAIFALNYSPSVAQNALPQAPAAPSSLTAGQTTPAVTPPGAPTTPPTSYPHHYLLQHLALTETDKTFYATREELGCSFAPGCSDSTLTTSVKFGVDTEALTRFLTTIKPRVNSKLVLAHPVLVSPIEHEVALKSDNLVRPAVIVPAVPAVSLLVPESCTAIADMLANSPMVASIPLTVEEGPVPASKSTLDGIDSRIAHFVTHFNPGEIGRTVTVRRAIQLIDGTVLAPGDIFSINHTVGVRTIARGFGIGKVFINGTMQDQVGGGMCQVATTLFNAALLANLKIIERHQHVRTVPYVPAGGDATVYFGEKDFQFQNDTTAPVYIYYKTYGSWAVADLYGKGEPDTKVKVETIATKLGDRYYKGVIRRFVTEDGRTVSNFTAYSTYQWTPSLDYLR